MHSHQEISQKLKKDTSMFQILKWTNVILCESPSFVTMKPLGNFFVFLFKENWGFHYSSFALALNFFKNYFLFKVYKRALSWCRKV